MGLTNGERNFLNIAKKKYQETNKNEFSFSDLGIDAETYEEIKNSLEEKGYIESLGSYITKPFRITAEGLQI
ncbi:MAG: hypothetical protein LKJ17_12105 [Oscillospiraceae bacterium]|jgi:hypothetical protein|nr:hypothetical protein [Oscillospiraceae bacterium]